MLSRAWDSSTSRLHTLLFQVPASPKAHQHTYHDIFYSHRADATFTYYALIYSYVLYSLHQANVALSSSRYDNMGV